VLASREGVVVPTASVVRRPAGDVVYVLTDDKVAERKVTVGLRDRERPRSSRRRARRDRDGLGRGLPHRRRAGRRARAGLRGRHAMKLAELSVRRHVLAFMASAVFVLFGLVAYERIGVDRFPRVEFPVISITTVLPGANPDVVDASITNIIETAVNSVPRHRLHPVALQPGVSNVALTFDLSKDIDVAFSEVQAKVNQVLRQLPDDADPPVVLKVEVGANAVMWLALQGDRTTQQLNQYARRSSRSASRPSTGVGQVRIGGERRRNIRVNLDLDRMAALGVTAQDVRDAFRTEHVQLPAASS
jgi:hydrophobic/amphiphilic exporter-1 (mainly G- bacteria), HAE1 family